MALLAFFHQISSGKTQYLCRNFRRTCRWDSRKSNFRNYRERFDIILNVTPEGIHTGPPQEIFGEEIFRGTRMGTAEGIFGRIHMEISRASLKSIIEILQLEDFFYEIL